MNFIIPTANNLKKSNVNPINSNSNNITDYTKICQNVYKFTYNTKNTETDIYVLYNNACETKHNDQQNALQMFKKCEELINETTDTNIIYEIYVNLALLSFEFNDVSNYYTKAIDTINDRAEPYYYFGLYCKKLKLFEMAYTLFITASKCSYEQAKNKYVYVQRSAYGKYVYEEVINVGYELKKFHEIKVYLQELIKDNEFFESKEQYTQILESIINHEIYGMIF
jgi:hypothetical protein